MYVFLAQSLIAFERPGENLSETIIKPSVEEPVAN